MKTRTLIVTVLIFVFSLTAFALAGEVSKTYLVAPPSGYDLTITNHLFEKNTWPFVNNAINESYVYNLYTRFAVCRMDRLYSGPDMSDVSEVKVGDIDVEGYIMNVGKMPLRIVLIVGNVQEIEETPTDFMIIDSLLEPGKLFFYEDLLTKIWFEVLAEATMNAMDGDDVRAFLLFGSDGDIDVKYKQIDITTHLEIY